MTLDKIGKMLQPRLDPDTLKVITRAITAYGRDEYNLGFEAGQQAIRDEPVKPSRG